jgi:hypothetical protein
MGSNTAGVGLLAKLQHQLALGRSDEDSLADLTAGGLSRQSAERFLERARTGSTGAAPARPMPAPPRPSPVVPPTLPPPVPGLTHAASFDAPPPLPGEAPTYTAPPLPLPPAPAPEAPASNRAWIGVIGGAVTLTLGLAAVAWALSQDRNVRIRLPLFIVITGGGWMLQAVRSAVDRRPATWLVPAIAAVPPLLAVVVVLGTLAAGRPRASEPADADPAAVATGSAGAARPSGRRTTRPPTREERIAESVETLDGQRQGDRCHAAYTLARVAAREQVPILEHHLSTATETPHKVCLAYALVLLGEGDAMLSHYLEWSRAEDDQLRHHGIVGFGHVGPSAASDALPVLEAAIASGSTPTRRFTVVRALARLGLPARPLLQTLARDDDPEVRAEAQKTLTWLR